MGSEDIDPLSNLKFEYADTPITFPADGETRLWIKGREEMGPIRLLREVSVFERNDRDGPFRRWLADDLVRGTRVYVRPEDVGRILNEMEALAWVVKS